MRNRSKEPRNSFDCRTLSSRIRVLGIDGLRLRSNACLQSLQNFFSDFPDIARAHRDENIAFADELECTGRELVLVGNVNHGTMSVRGCALCYQLAGDAIDRLLSRRIDV